MCISGDSVWIGRAIDTHHFFHRNGDIAFACSSIEVAISNFELASPDSSRSNSDSFDPDGIGRATGTHRAADPDDCISVACFKIDGAISLRELAFARGIFGDRVSCDFATFHLAVGSENSY